ncbi:unnamed protein product [Lota lota]
MVLKLHLEVAAVFSIDGNTTADFQHDFLGVFRSKRPVDHSTQYDHQQILLMEDDPVVRKADAFLFDKHPAVSSVYVLA